MFWPSFTATSVWWCDSYDSLSDYNLWIMTAWLNTIYHKGTDENACIICQMNEMNKINRKFGWNFIEEKAFRVSENIFHIFFALVEFDLTHLFPRENNKKSSNQRMAPHFDGFNSWKYTRLQSNTYTQRVCKCARIQSTDRCNYDETDL